MQNSYAIMDDSTTTISIIYYSYNIKYINRIQVLFNNN